MTKHSPGPWKRLDDEIFDANGKYVLEHIPYEGLYLHNPEENMPLFAAAQELLEALEIICSEFAQGHPLIVAGRAAIAKAKEDVK